MESGPAEDAPDKDAPDKDAPDGSASQRSPGHCFGRRWLRASRGRRDSRISAAGATLAPFAPPPARERPRLGPGLRGAGAHGDRSRARPGRDDHSAARGTSFRSRHPAGTRRSPSVPLRSRANVDGSRRCGNAGGPVCEDTLITHLRSRRSILVHASVSRPAVSSPPSPFRPNARAVPSTPRLLTSRMPKGGKFFLSRRHPVPVGASADPRTSLRVRYWGMSGSRLASAGGIRGRRAR